MTTTTDPVGALLQAADPLLTRAAVDPGVVADLEASWARIGADATTPTRPSPRRGRRTALLVAVVAVAVAAVGIPLVLPSRGPVALPYAHAATVDELVANARATSGPVQQTTTMRQWSYGAAQTSDGPAYYRAESTLTRSLGTDDAFTTTYDGAPLQWLTPADARRGALVAAELLPAVGRTTTSGTSSWPSAAAIAALPADPDALLAAVPAVCEPRASAVCVETALLPVVTHPGSTAAQRAAAIVVLSRQQGVTVLGPQQVDGRDGIALRFETFPLDPSAETMVFDAVDGSVLSTTSYAKAPAAGDRADPTVYPAPVGAVVGGSVRVF